MEGNLQLPRAKKQDIPLLKPGAIALAEDTKELIVRIGNRHVAFPSEEEIKILQEHASLSGAVAKSNGVNDNDYFMDLIERNSRVVIPKGVTLKLGYNEVSRFLTITKPVEISGGGTIEFIGDFTKTKMIRVRGKGIVFRDIHFIHHGGTYPADVNGFIEFYEAEKCSIEKCSFQHGMVFIFKGAEITISQSLFLDSAITGRGGKNHTVRDNTFEHVPGSPIRDRTSIVVQSTQEYPSERYIIENNLIKNAEWAGVTLFKFNKDSVIRNNTIYFIASTNEGFGMSLANIDNCRCYNNTIINEVQDFTYAGIEVVDCRETIVRDNKISGFKTGIICNGAGIKDSPIPYGKDNTLSNNLISRFTKDGIRLFRAVENILVQNNVIELEINKPAPNDIMGIFSDSDGYVSARRHIIRGNRIKIKKTIDDVYNIIGIHATVQNTDCIENEVIVSGLNLVTGLRGVVSDAGTYPYLINSTFTFNKISVTASVNRENWRSFGIRLLSSAGTKTLSNCVFKYNVLETSNIAAAYKMHTVQGESDLKGNSIVQDNFIN